MTAIARYIVGPIILSPLVTAGLALLHAGVYGWTLFVISPFWIGVLAAWVVRGPHRDVFVALPRLQSLPAARALARRTRACRIETNLDTVPGVSQAADSHSCSRTPSRRPYSRFAKP